MADLFQLGNLAVTDPNVSKYPIGDLRRRYNFGDRVSELAIAQDPFFRFVSKVAKNPVDDPQFKFTERRPSYHKRYAYPIAVSADGVTWDADGTHASAYFNAASTVYVKMATDYKKEGNIQNIYGQSTNEIKVGASGTQPQFYVVGSLVKVNLADSAGGAVSDYSIMRVEEVTPQAWSADTDHSTVDAQILKGTLIRKSTKAFMPHNGDLAGDSVYGSVIADTLEPKRSYVVGTAHAQGSGYPATWKDQPFTTGYGNTQIWKTAMAMDNTTRATQLKFEQNEWGRVWREKLIEHKWDIEQSLLFSAQQDSGTEWTTQGAVDYILGAGNIFDGSTIGSTKTQDDFLNDMSSFLDPRYNTANATLFFVGTSVYNWLHKLSGYFKQNLGIGQTAPGATGNQALYTADMALTGKKKVFGVDITTISTPYGDMNVARNIHLDGTAIKILAVNMKYCKYRPLVGNGLNRDTAIYVGVQTLENSGVDRRVDLIQTEAGMEWQMPEAHAVWK